MMVLTALGVTVRLRGRILLDGVDLAVAPGQVVALVGPNGAGKSTLLRALSGELRPDAGEVSLGGLDIGRWRAQDLAQRRAIVTQHADRDCQLTARQIVELGRLPWGRPARDRDGARAIDLAMTRTGAARFADRSFATLSGGERQRVHLARALAQIHGPDGYVGRLLLLDEPTSHMDIAAQLESLSLIADLATTGLSAVVVLHDLAAACMADRVCVIRDGRRLAMDRPSAALTPAVIDAAFQVRAERFEAVAGGAAFAFHLPQSTGNTSIATPPLNR